MSLIPYWLRHMRSVARREPLARVFEDPFAVFSRDPFFRDPEQIFKQLDHIEGADCSEVKVDGKKIEVTLDVQNFTPEQIEVKTVGNEITVEGKREVKREDGWTRSHFERRFLLPAGFPAERVECHLDKGRLVLAAFRAEPLEERTVPVIEKSEDDNKTS